MEYDLVLHLVIGIMVLLTIMAYNAIMVSLGPTVTVEHQYEVIQSQLNATSAMQLQ